MSESKNKKAAEKAHNANSVQDDKNTVPYEEKPKPAVVTAEQPGIFVYAGPNIPNGLLKTGSVFKGTITEVLKHLEPVTSIYPEAAALLVSCDRLSEAQARIRAGGNYMARCYISLMNQKKK